MPKWYRPAHVVKIRLVAPYCCAMATIPLDLIPPFLAVAELGSFSIAAQRLGVEKSSVSRAVARLEQGVGDRLFLRTTRRVSLTDAGRRKSRSPTPCSSRDRKSTRLNSRHTVISYAVFCLKKKKNN